MILSFNISTTDTGASVTRRGKGKSKLKYQIHRGVDQKREVITATEVTPGEIYEAHLLESLIDTQEKNTQTTVETTVADSKYGSIEKKQCRKAKSGRTLKRHVRQDDLDLVCRIDKYQLDSRVANI